LLKTENRSIDSVHAKKEKVYRNLDSLNQICIKNLEQAYESSLKINQNLDLQMQKCEALAKNEQRKVQWKSMIWGALGGLTTGTIVAGIAFR